MMAGGMKAEHDFGAGRLFDAEALRANGHAAVAAHFEESAHAPHISPPRTARGGAQHGTFFLLGVVPGILGSLAQLAMNFLGISMVAQRLNVRISFGDFQDFLAGEISRQAALPE